MVAVRGREWPMNTVGAGGGKGTGGRTRQGGG